MNASRLDTAILDAAVSGAVQHLVLANALLRPVLVALTKAERADAARPGVRFPDAGRALARAARQFPALAAGTGFDPEAVEQGLANVELLAPVSQLLGEIAHIVDDSRLQWLSEAYRPSLVLYGAAKAVSAYDGRLHAVIEPMAEVFAARRSPEPAGEHVVDPHAVDTPS